MQHAPLEGPANDGGADRSIVSDSVAINELRRQNEILQTIFDNIPVMINFIDPTGRVQLVNRHWEDVLGWSRDEACSLDIFSAAYPDSDRRQDVLDYVANPIPGWREFKTRARDGRVIDTSWSLVVLSDGTRIGFGYDVTDQKRSEEKLKRSESQLAEAQQLAHIGSWNLDISTDTITWSDEMYRIFGLLPQDPNVTADFSFKMIHPDDQAVAQSVLDQALYNHQPYACCLRVRHTDGTYRIVDARGQVIYDEANKPLRIFGTSQDITERRQAEEHLRETQERFEQLAANIDGYFWLNSPNDGRMHYMSPGYERVTGISCESLYQRPSIWTEIIHPEDIERVLAETLNTSDFVARQIEYRIQKRDGTVRWLRDRAFPVHNAAGEVYRIAGVGEDITAQKTAAEELQALNAALENAVEGIARLDTQGNHISVNRAYALMLGYLPEELISKNWVQTVYPEDIKKVAAAHARLSDNQRVEFEVRGVRKDGSVFWKQMVLLKAWNTHGECTGNYCFMKDVTERKLSEEVMRAYVQRLQEVSQRVVEIQEAERSHLARELHDEIGQVLSAISMNLQSAARVCDVAAQPRLADSIQIVGSAIEQVRNLSLDLRPAMLDELGLVATLRWYADRQAQRAGFTLHFGATCSGHRLPTTIETACYRVAQESLTNVVRHAEARNVWVTFSEISEQDTIELIIRDDGVGFNTVDLRHRTARGASFGVQGMQERMELVGGELVIESTPNCGTLIIARIPSASFDTEGQIKEDTIDADDPSALGG
jgi:PAS domain S-box-containing protein